MPYYHWHLSDVERLEMPMKPHRPRSPRMPQTQWFAPFNLPTVPKIPKGKAKGPATMKLKLKRDWS